MFIIVILIFYDCLHRDHIGAQRVDNLQSLIN